MTRFRLPDPVQIGIEAERGAWRDRATAAEARAAFLQAAAEELVEKFVEASEELDTARHRMENQSHQIEMLTGELAELERRLRLSEKAAAKPTKAAVDKNGKSATPRIDDNGTNGGKRRPPRPGQRRPARRPAAV